MRNPISPEEIADLRGRSGLTQPEFGRVFDVSQVTVSKWERGLAVPKEVHRAMMLQYRQRLDGINQDQRRKTFAEHLLKTAVGVGIGAIMKQLFSEAESSDN